MNIEEIGLTVLLLASQARLLELFRSLEAQGMLQLQVASSITDAERLLTENPPDFAFVQSRISALSGDILLRHVRSLLSEDSKVVLLSRDQAELDKASDQRALAINLGSSDDLLRHAVRELLLAAERPEQPANEPEPPAEDGLTLEDAFYPDEPRAPRQPSHTPPNPPSGTEEEMVHASPFESAFEESLKEHRKREAPAQEQLTEPPAMPAAPQKPKKRRTTGIAPARSLRDFAPKSYLSPRKLRRRTLFAIIGGLLLCTAAAVYLLLPAKKELIPIPPRPSLNRPPAQSPPAAAPSHPAPPQQAAPKADDAVVPETPPPHAKSARGLADLPPFIVDAEQDPEYGKTHPGWERYLTSRMEYKIFREGRLIKAVQIMAARDETVPPDLFKWAKKEFAVTGSSQLLSKEQKGKYQVEKWQSEGAGLTVYRKVPDLKMRALVLYFR